MQSPHNTPLPLAVPALLCVYQASTQSVHCRFRLARAGSSVVDVNANGVHVCVCVCLWTCRSKAVEAAAAARAAAAAARSVHGGAISGGLGARFVPKSVRQVVASQQEDARIMDEARVRGILADLKFIKVGIVYSFRRPGCDPCFKGLRYGQVLYPAP